jgi:IPT/TIG domain-containing protein
MKRTLVLAMLLTTGAVLAAGTASADGTGTAARHIRGVVAPQGVQGPAGATGNLTWHGGPVMHSSNVYAVYWAPPGYPYQAGYDSAIAKYFSDVAADSGKSSNVYGVATQYGDGVGSAAYVSSFRSSLQDTNPYPANGCTDDPYTSVCLTDAQIQSELQSFLAAKGLPTGMSTAYFVFFPIGVGSCFDSTSTSCSYKQFCAYHGWIGTGGTGTVIYANMPYADQPSAGTKCDIEASPNGNDADATINVTSHENIEMLTDPVGNAWYDSAEYEIADKCAWIFGSSLGSTQYGAYNQAIASGKYMLQEEWTNVLSTCVQNAIVPAPQITSMSPTRGKAGTLIYLNGQNLLGASKVQLRGVNASFTIVSATRVSTRVPTGVSGLAQWTVTTPGGTAKSAYFCAC